MRERQRRINNQKIIHRRIARGENENTAVSGTKSTYGSGYKGGSTGKADVDRMCTQYCVEQNENKKKCVRGTDGFAHLPVLVRTVWEVLRKNVTRYSKDGSKSTYGYAVLRTRDEVLTTNVVPNLCTRRRDKEDTRTHRKTAWICEVPNQRRQNHTRKHDTVFQTPPYQIWLYSTVRTHDASSIK